MANDRSEELQKIHDQGQKDASKGEYNPPSKLGGLYTSQESEEDLEAYLKGHNNAS